jgi:hypothetical protein
LYCSLLHNYPATHDPENCAKNRLGGSPGRSQPACL